jgi:hypothetical protein
MTTISYVSTPSRLLNYILTGDPTGLDSRDIDTCNKWFSPEVLGVILDVERPTTRLTRLDEPLVCIVCQTDH